MENNNYEANLQKLAYIIKSYKNDEETLQEVKEYLEKNSEFNGALLSSDIINNYIGGRSILINLAVEYGKSKVLNYLLDTYENIDINKRDILGYTALFLAVWNKKIEMVKILINTGKIKDEYISSALHLGINDIEMVKILIEKVVDINVTNINGSTALHLAINNIETMQFLIEKGIDINAKNKYGNTVLHVAVWNNYYDIVQFLIEKGADINEKNNNGNMVLDLAFKNNDIEMVLLIINNGAKFKRDDIINSIVFDERVDEKKREQIKNILDKGSLEDQINNLSSIYSNRIQELSVIINNMLNKTTKQKFEELLKNKIKELEELENLKEANNKAAEVLGQSKQKETLSK